MTVLRAALLAALALLLAGCGGDARPALDRADANGLIAIAHRIAGESACAQAKDIPALRKRAIALVNAGRVPSELQEPLMSGVAALEEQTPVCLPPVPASSTTPAPAAPRPRGHDRGHKHGHGHGKKHD